MDARGNGAARIVHCDAPKVANAKRKRARGGNSRVMKVVAVLLEVFAEGIVVFAAKDLEKFGAGLGDVHTPLRLIIPQTLARRPEIRAQIGVGFNGGTIRMERENIGDNRTWILVAGVSMKAVEYGIKVALLKQPQVFDENINRDFTDGTHRQGKEPRGVKRRIPLADTKPFHHLTEIAGQLALPAQGVDPTEKRGPDQFVKP